MNRAHAMTLVEVAVAAAILATTMLAVMATLMGGAEGRLSADQSEIAAAEIMNELEELRSLTPAQVLVRLRDELPAGENRSLRSIDELPQGSLTSEVLDEATCQVVFGTASPPDLDGDGDPARSDPSRYAIMPVRIVVRWQGNKGPRTRQISTIISPRSTGS